jgi:glucokinase
MKRNLALGVDIGGTNSVFGLCDEHGTLYFEESVYTREYPTPEELVDKIYERIKSVGHLPNVKGIGIGAPNGNYFSGTIEFAPNLK